MLHKKAPDFVSGAHGSLDGCRYRPMRVFLTLTTRGVIDELLLAASGTLWGVERGVNRQSAEKTVAVRVFSLQMLRKPPLYVQLLVKTVPFPNFGACFSICEHIYILFFAKL